MLQSLQEVIAEKKNLLFIGEIECLHRKWFISKYDVMGRPDGKAIEIHGPNSHYCDQLLVWQEIRGLKRYFVKT